MDNQLQNKLIRFEAVPPAGVWDKIAEALDEGQLFSERLYNYTEIPGTINWRKIEEGLDIEAHPAKTIPFTTRFRNPIRYVAAASIIGIIAIATTLLMKRTEAGALQAGSKTTVPVKEPVTPPPNQNSVVQNNTVAVITPVVKVKVQQQPTFKRRLLNILQPQKFLASVAVAGRFLPQKVSKEALFNNTLLNSYMVFSDGTGMAMRLPKKLFPMVQCNEGDGSCLQRIKSLQKKLSTASLTSDFTSVLEMLRQIQ
jgi:hypothetical protein